MVLLFFRSQGSSLENFKEEFTDRSTLLVKGYDVCFKEVSFAYPSVEQKAVDGVSFSIPQGKTVALVGASGGGKTTIARLVPHFWEASEGEVLIGGVNVKEIDSKELVCNKTVLIIAHRMRTIANADKIVVLESGEVAEAGAPADLQRCNGVFARMVARQTVAEG